MAWASADLGNQAPVALPVFAPSPVNLEFLAGTFLKTQCCGNPICWKVGKAWHSHNIDDRLILASGYKYPGLL
jgi:hypothetical protein